MVIEISLYYATMPGDKNQEGGAKAPPIHVILSLTQDLSSLTSYLLPLISVVQWVVLGSSIEGSASGALRLKTPRPSPRIKVGAHGGAPQGRLQPSFLP